MKIKGVIEDLRIKKTFNLKNDSKNISRTFSGVVVGSVESVHFRILIRLIFLKIYRPLPM